MVVTLQAVAHQSHHNLTAEIHGSVLVVVVPAAVHTEVSTEPSGGIAEAPKLDPPLHWLLRHVLLPAQTTIELYHRLVDRHIARRLVTLAKVLLAKGDQWADLRQLVVPVLIPWHRTVEVLAEFLIPCTRQYAGDEGVMQEWLSRPVVLVARKVLDAHGDVDTYVGLDLISSRQMPEWIASFKLEMRSISAGGGRLHHSIEVCSLSIALEEIDAKHLFKETDWLRARGQQGCRSGRVVERLNVRWVDVSSLVPARLNDDIRSNLTTSSAPTSPAPSATATSSSDTSCSATTYRCSCRCCWHLYI